MALVAHVHGCALGVACRFPRRNEGVEAGSRSSAREKPARALRIAEPAPEPVNDDQLELARPACDQPGALVDVVSGGQEVGQHPGSSGRRGDEPEATRVVQPRRDREYLSRGPLDDPLCRPSSGGFSISRSMSSCLNSPSQAFSPGRCSIRSTKSSAALRARSSMSSGAIWRPSCTSPFAPELGSLALCVEASDMSGIPLGAPLQSLKVYSCEDNICRGGSEREDCRYHTDDV